MTKVMMNNPVTNTAASEAKNSTVVSFCFSSATFSISFFANVIVRSLLYYSRVARFSQNYKITQLPNPHQFTSRKVRFQRVI